MDSDHTPRGTGDADASRPEGADDLIQRLERERSWIVSLARGLAFDSDAADDLVQEAFIAALRAPPRDRANLRPWLRGVLRNLSRAGARRDLRRERREERAARPEGRDEDPSAAIERLELRQQLIAALLALEEPYRSAVVLRHIEEVPAAEIARRTGANESTVRTRIQRGLERVRAHLDRVHGGSRDRWLLLLIAMAGSVVGPVAAQAEIAGNDSPAASSQSGAGSPRSGSARGAVTVSRVGFATLPVALVLVGIWYFGSGPAGSVRRDARLDSPENLEPGPSAPLAIEPSPAPRTEETSSQAPTDAPPTAVFTIRILDPDGAAAPGTTLALLAEARVERLREDLDLPARVPPLAFDLAWIHGERVITDTDGLAHCPIAEFPVVIAIRGRTGSAQEDADDPENLRTEIVLEARPLVRVIDAGGRRSPSAWLGVSREGDHGHFGLRIADDEGVVDLSWSHAHYLSRPPRWSVRAIPHIGPSQTIANERVVVDFGAPAVFGSLALRLAPAALERIRPEERSITIDWWDAGAVDDPDLFSPRFRLGGLRFEPKDGEVVIPAVGDGLIVRVRATHCLPSESRGPTPGSRVEISLDPDPAVHEIIVPIVSEDGEPLALRHFGVLDRASRALRALGSTDERGVARFRVERDELTREGLFLELSAGSEAQGRDPNSRAVIRVPDDPPPRCELPPAVLERAPVILSGVLQDPSGRGEGGHTIEIRMEHVSATERRRETTTDASGRFEIRGEVPAGPLEVQAEDDGLVLATALAAVGGTELVLIAERGFPKRIEGRLIGFPEDAGKYHWIDWNGPGGGRGQIDPDGSFSLRVLHPEGELILRTYGVELYRTPVRIPPGLEAIDIGGIDIREIDAESPAWREYSVRTKVGEFHVGELEIVGRVPGSGRIRLRAREGDHPGQYRVLLPDQIELAAARAGTTTGDGRSWSIFDPWKAHSIVLRPAIVAEIEVLDAEHPRFAKGLGWSLIGPHEGWLAERSPGVHTREVRPGEPLRVLVGHSGTYQLAWSEWRDRRWREFGRTQLEITDDDEQLFSVRALESP